MVVGDGIDMGVVGLFVDCCPTYWLLDQRAWFCLSIAVVGEGIGIGVVGLDD